MRHGFRLASIKHLVLTCNVNISVAKGLSAMQCSSCPRFILNGAEASNRAVNCTRALASKTKRASMSTRSGLLSWFRDRRSLAEDVAKLSARIAMPSHLSVTSLLL